MKATQLNPNVRTARRWWTLAAVAMALLSKAEIDAAAARREVIVSLLDKQIAAKSEAAILYDLPRMKEACGTGL